MKKRGLSAALLAGALLAAGGGSGQRGREHVPESVGQQIVRELSFGRF